MSETPTRRDLSQAVRVGLPATPLADLYYQLLRRPWRWLIGGLGLVYLLLNLGFAGLYALDPEGLAGPEGASFAQAFNFSVQTFATIGYGGITPVSAYAHGLVTLEALAGIMYTAIATGLVFAKFSLPTARVMFSNTMVVTRRHGRPCLQLRVANTRGNELVEASVRVTVIKSETTPEGQELRRLHDLKLVRAMTPLFVLSWLIMHDIDEDSPLWGETAESLAAERVLFVVTLTGMDGTFSQTVHARKVYEFHDLHWGYRFVDVIEREPGGGVRMELGRFDDVVADRLDYNIPLV